MTSSHPEYLFYRFKLGMRLTAIVVGLKNAQQASYLEQTNLDLERRLRNPAQVLYLREEVSAINMPALRDAIRLDPDVTAAGYCR